MDISPKKLMTLGPVEIEEEILKLGSHRMVYNRTSEFSEIIKEIHQNLQYIFQTKNEVMILTSSGTGSMETAVVNTLSVGDEVLIANNGTFGERWAEICRTHHLNVKEIKDHFGHKIDPIKIKDNITPETKAVLITANESSSCTLSDVEAIGKIVHETKAILIVDAITAICCDQFKTDEWHADVVIASSNKGLVLPPGLSFISFSDKAWDHVERSTLPKYYFNIKEYKKNIVRGQTPFTPPISLLIQLKERLKKIRETGIENILQKNKYLSMILREGLRQLGLGFTSEHLSNCATGIIFPEGINAREIVDLMDKEYNIMITPSPPPDEQKMVKVSILGDINENDVNKFLQALEKILTRSKQIKKVMLISPKSVTPKRGLRRLTVPMGLLYIGANLREGGYEVKIVDSSCEGYHNMVEEGGGYISYGLSDNELKEKLLEFQPDLIGVSSPCSARHGKAIEICKTIKETIDTSIVVGGVHPTNFPEDTIKSEYVDYVIMGEGEFRFLKLINHLNNKEEPNFDGVAYKKNGEIIIKKNSTWIQDLNSLPFPARDLIDMEKVFDIALPFAPFSKSHRVGEILTSRGCPGQCNFCASKNFWGRRFRMRSVENIISEVRELVEKYGIKELQFIDDNLTLDKERAIKIFEELKQFNLRWCTPQGLMIRTIDKEMIKLMAESGAYQITIAVESGSERVRREIIRKPIPPKEKVKELIDAAHENGIQVHGLFITGLPRETKEEIYKTMNYPFEVGFDSVVFSIASPLPGSELHTECVEKGYLSEELKVMNFRTGEIVIPKDDPNYVMSSEELEELIKETTRKFNDFSRAKNPESWNDKFNLFFEKHPEKKEAILGRIS